MRALEDLTEMLEDDVKKVIKKGDISPDELSNVYKAIDIIKDVETIKAMRGQGYSQAGSYNSYDGSYGSYNSYNRGSYDNSYDGSYDGSYGRRGRDGDGDGRYSEQNSMRYSGGNYSRHDERTKMIQKLETMMQNAQTEEQRRAIKKCIDEM